MHSVILLNKNFNKNININGIASCDNNDFYFQDAVYFWMFTKFISFKKNQSIFKFLIRCIDKNKFYSCCCANY